MGNQQNRVSKKRAFSSISAANSKNRVALGEITNLVNVDSGFDDKTPAPKLKKKGIKLVADLTEGDKSGQPEFEAGSDDGLKKCGSSSLIYQHLHSLEMEEKRRPLPDYLEKVQTDLTPGMREILVDWLVEVAEEYKLVSDTLYLTISYIDRFLSSRAMNRNQLQLLGVSSMLIASKHEEISPPHLEDFCYITDNTYTKEEVVDMEREILKFLNFDISSPTTKTFLRIFTRAAQEYSPLLDLKFEFLAAYLAELSLLDYGTVRFLPSMIAASVIFVSKFMMEPKEHPWSVAMQQYSGYKASELKDCVLAIHDLQMHRRGNSSQAIREKYKHQKFQYVSLLFSPSEIPQMYLRDYY